MAGLSSRFSKAGYTVPKYMLPVGSGFAFDYAVNGFAGNEEPFVFIHRGDDGTEAFIRARCAALSLPEPLITRLDQPTSGQAETVEKGLLALGITEGALTIFNIDTFRRRTPLVRRGPEVVGSLEVFVGDGENWSFVLPEGDTDKVIQTTEKRRISDLCCTGLYTFAQMDLFMDALARERVAPECDLGELYVAPLYNHLIKRGLDVRYDLTPRENILFCGVPAEYEAILEDPGLLDHFRPGT